MKQLIPLLLVAALAACGQSEAPRQEAPNQADVPTVEELAADPERLRVDWSWMTAAASSSKSTITIALRWLLSFIAQARLRRMPAGMSPPFIPCCADPAELGSSARADTGPGRRSDKN